MDKPVTAAMKAEFTEKSQRLAELRSLRDSLEFTFERAERERDAGHAALEPGNITAEQDARTKLVSETADRLRRVVTEKAEIEARLTELSKLLRSKDAAAAAADLVRKAQGVVAAEQSKLDHARATVAQIDTALTAEGTTLEQARGREKANALQGLPEFVRGLLDLDAATEQEPGPDLAAVEHRIAGLNEARARALLIVEQRAQALSDAQAAEAAATSELLVQRALAAEVDHSEAIAEYLPHLGRYFALHRAAFDFEPTPPDLMRIIEESKGEAMRAAQAESSAGLDQGLLKRGIRKLAALRL